MKRRKIRSHTSLLLLRVSTLGILIVIMASVLVLQLKKEIPKVEAVKGTLKFGLGT